MSGGEEGRGGTFFGEYPRQISPIALPTIKLPSAVTLPQLFKVPLPAMHVSYYDAGCSQVQKQPPEKFLRQIFTIPANMDGIRFYNRFGTLPPPAETSYR